MRTIGTIRAELIFSHPTGRSSASAIVPPEAFAALDAEKIRLGCATQWWYDNDPRTGVRQPAFTPIGGGRLTLIEGRGIRHGDRFMATIHINEVTRRGETQRQMWLVDAQPCQLQAVLEQSRRQIEEAGGIPHNVFWSEVEAESRKDAPKRRRTGSTN